MTEPGPHTEQQQQQVGTGLPGKRRIRDGLFDIIERDYGSFEIDEAHWSGSRSINAFGISRNGQRFGVRIVIEDVWEEE